MTEIIVNTGTAVVDVTAPNTATIITSGTFSAVVNENQATLVDNIIGATAIAEPAYIQFNINAVPSIQQGRLGWNNTDKTLDLGMDANVTQQVGQNLVILDKTADNSELVKGRAV